MSRLDDELRNVFRREQPSADFTARVLERVAQQPEPRASWWRRLAMLLEPPKLRWVAIAVTASLLLAIGAAQYGKLRKPVINDDVKIAFVPPLEQSNKSAANPGTDGAGREITGTTPKSPQRVKQRASSTSHRVALAQRQKEQELRTEGEAAKEKLMLALYIASATLNDAQKAVHDDGSPKP